MQDGSVMRFLAPLVIVLGLSATFVASACSYDWTYTGEDGGSSGSRGTEDGGTQQNDADKPPALAECSLGNPCAQGICRFSSTKCSGIGTCVDAECTDEEVCTCDGLLMSGCAAAKEGKSIDESGASCTAPPDAVFDCYGVSKCIVGKQYCDAKATKCVDFPPTCSKPDCSCPALPCSCSTDGSGNVIIKC